jgi:ATP-dependent DNA helicase RecG
MRDGVSSARNELIKNVMSHYGYLEYLGMGVVHKIISGMLKYNGADPELIEENERFIVRLWKEPQRS